MGENDTDRNLDFLLLFEVRTFIVIRSTPVIINEISWFTVALQIL